MISVMRRPFATPLFSARDCTHHGARVGRHKQGAADAEEQQTHQDRDVAGLPVQRREPEQGGRVQGKTSGGEGPSAKPVGQAAADRAQDEDHDLHRNESKTGLECGIPKDQLQVKRAKKWPAGECDRVEKARPVARGKHPYPEKPQIERGETLPALDEDIHRKDENACQQEEE